MPAGELGGGRQFLQETQARQRASEIILHTLCEKWVYGEASGKVGARRRRLLVADSSSSGGLGAFPRAETVQPPSHHSSFSVVIEPRSSGLLRPPQLAMPP